MTASAEGPPDPGIAAPDAFAQPALETPVFRILHVSTGNVCRSPITERLTRQALVERLGDGASSVVVESAGTWGHEGAPMEEHAAALLAEYGADPGGFFGRELLDEHVIRADLVLTATRDHRAQVISMGHSAGLRTFTLKEFTRLVRAIDLATLPVAGTPEALVDRARALARAAAALRGWLLAPSVEADEVQDPYGAPLPYFRSVGEEIRTALDPVVTALTGVPARGRDMGNAAV
ncbi:arsenate reductase/protein-tyrosine-phosphatase family protein [Streptomyces triticirhizae]|uniref:protein-tyrosine-phosphatase n=1 Tax=Streptomyces triticirhizae TaxID=2483353 RepID=A0A3M2LI04_9ACTN|nr:protein-tyrosine-phosphatase [Streptomyces triticirhizae]